jgi:hypothetical protein
MHIESIEVYNLFSYGDKQKMSFSEATSLVVGPNDSDKTNIIRILKLLIETLRKYPAPSLSPYIIFSNVAKPSLKIRLILSRKETSAIVGFLSFYRRTGDYEYFNYNNWDNLGELPDTLQVNVSREEVNISSQESMRSQVSFVFEKIHLSITQKDDGTLQFEVDERSFRPSLTFLELLGRIDDCDGFLSELRNINVDDVTSVIDMDRLFDSSNITDNSKLQALKSILYFAQEFRYSLGNLTFVHLIEVLLRRGVHFSNRNSTVYSKGTLARTNNLSEDSRNLASFLYSLKMSPNLDSRKRYTDIQEKF